MTNVSHTEVVNAARLASLERQVVEGSTWPCTDVLDVRRAMLIDALDHAGRRDFIRDRLETALSSGTVRVSDLVRADAPEPWRTFCFEIFTDTIGARAATLGIADRLALVLNVGTYNRTRDIRDELGKVVGRRAEPVTPVLRGRDRVVAGRARAVRIPTYQGLRLGVQTVGVRTGLQILNRWGVGVTSSGRGDPELGTARHVRECVACVGHVFDGVQFMYTNGDTEQNPRKQSRRTEIT